MPLFLDDMQSIMHESSKIVEMRKHEHVPQLVSLAPRLEMTREAVREHLLQLESEGWIEKHTNRDSGNGGGRPSMHYSVTPEGEHLFPKNYDSLTVEESMKRENFVRGLLQIPNNLRIVAIIGLGYPDVEPQPKQMYPLETVFHREAYNH